MVYSIVYCFCDKNGYIEQNESGEIVYSTIIEADSPKEAIIKLKEKERFLEEPDILNIVEVQNDNNWIMQKDWYW